MNNIDKIVSLYSGLGWKSIFAKLRFWYAPFIEVEKLAPKNGTIVDLGCGEGILTNYLGISAPKRRVIGIEMDDKRVKQADHKIPNVTFKKADVTKIRIPNADAIIFVHLLHHLHSLEAQENLIKECVRNLKKNGTIIIVEIHVKPSLKYFLSWIADHLLVAWIFEKKLRSSILFRKKEDWINLLQKNKLICKTIYPKGLLKPFSNIILYCKKNNGD